MSGVRPVEEILQRRATIEGAGVRLRRVFGFNEAPRLDPFLLLDDFGSDDPKDYVAGFPWHPHRGIETVTYMLSGEVEHGDSLGNSGVIGAGDVQWMTAGSGVIHQEMPQPCATRLAGFQLWVNLPASHKMMDPRYRGVAAGDIPEVRRPGGARIKVIAGRVDGALGPVRDVVASPEYCDVLLPPGAEFSQPAAADRTALIYVAEGRARVGEGPGVEIDEGRLAVLGPGDTALATAGEAGARLLFIAGAPLGEPVAWRGPIVMNTEEELETAFREYWEGGFIKKREGG